MLSSHVMPDTEGKPASNNKKAAFIWYHADAQMEDVLRQWVAQTSQTLSVSARLMVRQQPERTTFMEIYEVPENVDLQGVLEGIEKDAANQAWFVQLHSPRKAEIFVERPLSTS